MALRPPAAGCARQSRPSGHRCAASARADPPVFPGWTPVIDFPVCLAGRCPSSARVARSARTLDALCAPRQGPLPPARAVDVRRPPAWADAFAWAKGQTPLPRRFACGVRGRCPPPFYRGLGAPAVGVRRRATNGGSPDSSPRARRGLAERPPPASPVPRLATMPPHGFTQLKQNVSERLSLATRYTQRERSALADGMHPRGPGAAHRSTGGHVAREGRES